MKKKGTEGQRDKGTKKRLFVFGPGILIALMIGAFVVAKNYIGQEKPKKIGLWRIYPEFYSGDLVSINALLGQAKELDLNDAQKKSIQALNKKYSKDAKPLIETLDAASREFSSYMSSQKGKKTSITDIQGHSQDVQRFSRELSQLKKFYFEQAMSLLSEKQKKQIKNFTTFKEGKP